MEAGKLFIEDALVAPWCMQKDIGQLDKSGTQIITLIQYVEPNRIHFCPNIGLKRAQCDVPNGGIIVRDFSSCSNLLKPVEMCSNSNFDLFSQTFQVQVPLEHVCKTLFTNDCHKSNFIYRIRSNWSIDHLDVVIGLLQRLQENPQNISNTETMTFF